MLETLAGDVRWAARHARRRPLFAFAIAATLALAVAASTTAYGLARAVLWRDLPFADASRLVFVWENASRDADAPPARVTSGRYAAWRDLSRSFASIAMFGAAGFAMDEPGGVASTRGVRVSGRYFDVLGVAPLLGRAFTPADETPGSPVVILSHALWQQRFGGRATVVNESVRLNGHPYTIVGVMPPLVFPAWPVNPAIVTLDPEAQQLWVPIVRTPAFEQNTRSHVFGVVARLAPGVSMAGALDEVNALTRADDIDRHGAWITPLREQFVSEARLPLLLLMGAAIAVLLIACANLAALHVTNFETRRQEFQVRVAIGAGAIRLALQILAEALLLALAGGIAGLVLSRIALGVAPSLLPSSVPFLTPPGLDSRVAAFAIGVSVLAAMALSAWPIARLFVMGASPRALGVTSRTAVFRGLVVAQIAVTVALVVSAGLLAQSLWMVRAENPGFRVEGILAADIGLSGTYRDPATVASAEQRVRDALLAQPGVTAVATAYDHPLEANWTNDYTLVGDTSSDRADARGQAELRIVSPEYFDALGVEVLDGRAFTNHEGLSSRGVAVVNEAFVRDAGGHVLGRRLRSEPPRFTWGSAVPNEFEIVGIVENERFRGLEHPAEPAVYLSTRQFPQQGFAALIRSEQPRAVAAGVRDAVRRVESSATIGRPRSLDDILAEQLIARSVTTDVIGGFASGALALAALGLYGLLAVFVSSRTREIGVRLALGAQPAAVARHILAESLKSVVPGVIAGLVLSLAAGRALAGLLVGVTPHDPLTLAFVAATLMLVAGAAAFVPARRAARVDPMTALRCD